MFAALLCTAFVPVKWAWTVLCRWTRFICHPSRRGMMFSTSPFVQSYVTSLVSMMFCKRLNWFCCKLAQVVDGWGKGVNDQLWESGGRWQNCRRRQLYL